MAAVLGYFAFIQLGDNCLGSKYGNLGNCQMLSECATRNKGEESDGWTGKYSSLWLDSMDPGDHSTAKLTIFLREPGIYSLIWRDENKQQTVKYRGEGMVSGGQLVGCYWNSEIDQHFLEAVRKMDESNK